MDQTFDKAVMVQEKIDHRIFFWTSRVVLILVLLFFCQIAYWWWWPYDVMTISDLRVVNPVTHGEGLVYEMDYCKSDRYPDIQGNVTFSFQNKLTYNVPGKIYGPLEIGCHTVRQKIEMPLLPPGEYKLEMRREYRVNPVRTIPVTRTSNEFIVGVPIYLRDPGVTELLDANSKLIYENKKLIDAISVLIKLK